MWPYQSSRNFSFDHLISSSLFLGSTSLTLYQLSMNFYFDHLISLSPSPGGTWPHPLNMNFSFDHLIPSSSSVGMWPYQVFLSSHPLVSLLQQVRGLINCI